MCRKAILTRKSGRKEHTSTSLSDIAPANHIAISFHSLGIPCSATCPLTRLSCELSFSSPFDLEELAIHSNGHNAISHVRSLAETFRGTCLRVCRPITRMCHQRPEPRPVLHSSTSGVYRHCELCLYLAGNTPTFSTTTRKLYCSRATPQTGPAIISSR
jgi:hypothetical protein